MFSTALLGQQQHEPPAGAHLILLAGAVIAALVFFGVSRWRKRRDQPAGDHERLPEEERQSGTDFPEDR